MLNQDGNEITGEKNETIQEKNKKYSVDINNCFYFGIGDRSDTDTGSTQPGRNEDVKKHSGRS